MSDTKKVTPYQSSIIKLLKEGMIIERRRRAYYIGDPSKPWYCADVVKNSTIKVLVSLGIVELKGDEIVLRQESRVNIR